MSFGNKIDICMKQAESQISYSPNSQKIHLTVVEIFACHIAQSLSCHCSWQTLSVQPMSTKIIASIDFAYWKIKYCNKIPAFFSEYSRMQGYGRDLKVQQTKCPLGSSSLPSGKRPHFFGQFSIRATGYQHPVLRTPATHDLQFQDILHFQLRSMGPIYLHGL